MVAFEERVSVSVDVHKQQSTHAAKNVGMLKNRTLYARDCLDVLTDEQALPDKSVDLIYLDPPFNSKSTYNLPFKGQYGKDKKPVMAFNDTWSWGGG